MNFDNRYFICDKNNVAPLASILFANGYYFGGISEAREIVDILMKQNNQFIIVAYPGFLKLEKNISMTSTLEDNNVTEYDTTVLLREAKLKRVLKDDEI